MTTTPITRARRRRVLPLAALATAGALLLAACGGGNDSASDTASSTPTGAANTTASASPSASSSATGTTGTTDGSTDGATDGASSGTDSSIDSNLLGTVPSSVTASTNEAAPEQVFSVSSPWNTLVTTDPIAGDSAEQLVKANLRQSVDAQGRLVRNANRAGVYINTRDWTDAVVAGGVPTTLVCRQQDCGEGSNPITVDVPTSVSPDPLYDGWFTIFDNSSGIAYDLWRARREADGTISFNYLREWQVDGPGFLRPYEVSARGSGLPLFGGLIRTGELERGEIDHALAISLPGPNKSYFVQPASSTDGNGVAGSVPEGARLRLRSNFQLTQPRDTLTGKLLPFSPVQRRYARTIIRALQTYGAIVVDRAAVPTLYMERTSNDDDGADTGAGGSTLGTAPVVGNGTGALTDPATGATGVDGLSTVSGTTTRPDLTMLQGYVLQNMKLSDFEVVADNTQTAFPYPRKSTTVDASGLAGVGAVGGSGTDSTEEGQ